MRIRNLDIDLNTEGWEKSEGRSNNVWGQVPISNLPFNLFDEAIAKNKKSCIWTCYDEEIYKKDKDGNILPIDLNNLPPTISATLKLYFENKYSVVAENMGMKIAVTLDLPTSYNYIVKFDKEKYPQVLRNFSNPSLKDKVLPYAIVSIDFLKAQQTPERVLEDGTVTSFSGDELILFEKSIRHSKIIENGASIDGYRDNIEFRYIENWIKSINYYAEKLLTNVSKEEMEQDIKKINSRIVRSFLLREFIGDCDFTDKNGGLVVNRELKTVTYAPNFDYGESFNSLILNKFFTLPPKNVLDEILKWDPKYVERKEANARGILAESLAQTYASDASKRNLQYVIKNYPEDVKEFTTSLVNMIYDHTLEKIVESYTAEHDVEDALLSNEEAKMFKIYLNTRAGWLQSQLNKSISAHAEDEKSL